MNELADKEKKWNDKKIKYSEERGNSQISKDINKMNQ